MSPRIVCFGLVSFCVCVMAMSSYAREQAGLLPDSDARPIVKIGLVDTFDPVFYVDTFSATVDYLNDALPQYRFRAVDIRWQDPEKDIAENSPDFLLVSGSYYLRLETSIGAQYLATRHHLKAPDVDHSLASVFIVRSDSKVKNLSDLQGSRIAVTQKESFDGWLIAQGEIVALGKDPDHFWSEVKETEYGIPDVVSMVKAGVADVGVLSTCELERLIARKAVAPDELRVIGEKPADGWCTRSTDRYPDAMMVASRSAQSDISRQVLIALLSLPGNRYGYEWSISDNSSGVTELLKDLKVGPYAYLRDNTLTAIVERYRTEIYLVTALILAIIFHIVVLNLLVRKRTRELTMAYADRRRMYEEMQKARSELVQLERMTLVAQFSNLFAHEIKQPITGILYYAQALKLRMKKLGTVDEMITHIVDQITKDAEKSADIVERVRGYAKHRVIRNEKCDLADIVREAGEPFRDRDFISVDVKAGSFVSGDRVELVLLVSNLMRNAIQAVCQISSPRVHVGLDLYREDWKLTVEDNGPEISEEVFQRLGKSALTTKPDGLGLGLTIVVALAEKHAGHLEFERKQPQGLKVTLVIKRLTDGNPISGMMQ